MTCIMTQDQMSQHLCWGFPIRKAKPLLASEVPAYLPLGEYVFATLQAPASVEATWREWFEAEGIPSGEDQ